MAVCLLRLEMHLQQDFKANLVQDAWRTIRALDGVRDDGCKSLLHEVDVIDLAKPTWVRWGMFQRDAALFAAERWTLMRCGKPTSIRVNYYRGDDGNFFYSKLAPTDVAGWHGLAQLNVRRILRRYF